MFKSGLILSMNKLFILIAIPLLSACSTWKGKPESALIQKYGIPDKKIVSDETTIFEYVNCGGFFNPIKAIAHGGSVCKRRMFKIVDHIVSEDLGTIYR